ncbi:MAG: hypothetical protein B7Y12_09945 [Rhizobiales bacterium 24-66-13]|jgi:hypothetical protein|uniref:hypothetical protein n=1 Tax=Xanthobacteraceae TaxID=335928 RepID=UPI000BD6B5D4|nr:MAG: hypothetical protein B7Z41_00190 [Rhizobiales bacterium 12-66-7]OYX75264.1 MAG: hypothetical protein B7Y95_02980 [Rhizobiales bacterium 32-66-11]OYY89064.1 MAG: hypothetical protein B7Y61_00515 [Rhizobiales bacterium 35-66-30]OYZ78053.1 MAG: hypothetical protein B7Y12_09945 [Rhizobiales bacterium 24-66-13]OZB11480.1 MAG: hypothetical protein B7X67_03775 [Rhizobiales bacterium 39-66-18]
MKRLALTVIAWSWIGAGAAFAAIPTTDAAQLTQHSETAGATIKLVPISTQRQNANQGVKCAVTTGKKASVTDPTVQPQSGAGSRTIQVYAPEMPAVPTAEAHGAALNSQTLFKSTGDVVAGLDASRSTLGAAQSAFRNAGSQVGTATTVMAAIDMNSAARLQNNLAWNGVMGSANIWVTALNALNLAQNSDISRATIGMRSATTSSSGTPTMPACTVGMVGMVGSGTVADPCRTAGSCSTTPPGSPVDPGCVAARHMDSDGNVLFYLSAAQDEARTAATAPSAQPPLSGADVAAAIESIQANGQ